MTTLVDFLEELQQGHRAVVLPAAEVERLVCRFGPRVRSMGFWNKSGDGSVEVPVAHVVEAVRSLDDRDLAEAVLQLRSPEEFAGILERGSASRLIDALSGLYLRQFQARVERFQAASDPAEVERLRNELSRDLFG